MASIIYKLEKIQHGIYHCVIDDMYDLAMTFCRVQEFYESPFPQIRGKNFKLLDFMRVYSKNNGDNIFTYPIDWCGFNVPSTIINSCYNKNKIQDLNDYDKIIKKIDNDICNEMTDDVNVRPKYYLIGTEGACKDTFKHEICHALYFLKKKYKKEADEVIKKLTSKCYDKFTVALTKLGYSDKVFNDEIQAYIATGIVSIEGHVKFNKKEKTLIEKIKKELESIYKKYEND
jgi:hypothetical protein